METLFQRNFKFVLKAYYQLTKPGILMGNTITAFGGFALASRGDMSGGLLFATLLGLCLIMASGCVANNYLDRNADQKMERTKSRALPAGTISLQAAKIFSAILCLGGILVLSLFTNTLTLSLALFGLFVYLCLYSTMKYYSVHATLIGAIAGAIPPVVGYTAVTNRLDLGALLVFILLVFWQMPHFYAIAIYRMKEYAAASIPVLPIKRGLKVTKIQMLLYTIAFIGSCIALGIGMQLSSLYWIVTLPLSGVWLVRCAQGFSVKKEGVWAKKMFIFSLIVITGLCAVVAI